MDKDDDFLYIAIEECAGNLEDFINMANADIGNDIPSLNTDSNKDNIDPDRKGRDPSIAQKKIHDVLMKKYKKISS